MMTFHISSIPNFAVLRYRKLAISGLDSIFNFVIDYKARAVNGNLYKS